MLPSQTPALAYRLARAALFRMPPESAHALTMQLIDSVIAPLANRLLGVKQISDPVTLMGLPFKNRIGLAAGLDKNGEHIDGLANLGFGFVEVGTVTPLAQAGNPKPRMFRLPEQTAVINRMGFNNGGLTAFQSNVAKAKNKGVLGLNIGKNAATPIDKAIDDYVTGLRGVYAQASYVTVNISSPNTKNLRSLQVGDELLKLLAALDHERDRLTQQYDRRVAIAVKIAPDLQDEEIGPLCAALQENHIDAVVATNTTINRELIQQSAHRDEAGGLSGAPVRDRSTDVIRLLRQHLPRHFPIIGVGGILSADDAIQKFQAGADLVQLYTGLIYQGPALVGQCAAAAREHFRSA